MRIHEIKLDEAYLTELKMSPTYLSKLAANVPGALVGVEFEMGVPDVDFLESFVEPEKDYDYYDAPSKSIDSAVEFFSSHPGHNSRRELDQFRSNIVAEYFNWVNGELDERWSKEGIKFLRDYIAENVDQDDYEDIDEYVVEVWTKEPRIYTKAKDNFDDEFRSNYDEEDWLEGAYPKLSDIEAGFNLEWPYWSEPNNDELTFDLAQLADEITDIVNRQVDYNDTYHGEARDPSNYVIEPDSSIDVDSSYAGLELISPPMPVDEMLTDIANITDWATRKGCETNNSTGLHINVSVPGFSHEKLDYIKLAIFLGDEYILDQFGRLGNTYAKSAIGKIKVNASRASPEQVAQVMAMLKQNLNTLASKLIHGTSTEKYTSINVQSSWVEFRSPGGNWLNTPIEQLSSTIHRCVVALDAACDPTKYRQEYIKKFYKLISPQADDIAQLFSRYANGALTAEQFKSEWADRTLNKNPTAPATQQNPKMIARANSIQQASTVENWFTVTYKTPDTELSLSPPPITQRVVAINPAAAIDLFRTKFNLPVARFPNENMKVIRGELYREGRG